MKCKNRKRCGFYLAFGYCVKAIGENCPDLKDTIREIHDNVAQEMYCKGIDDFVEKVELKYLGVNPDELYEKYYPREICEQIKEIAEQLKEQNKEEI